MVSYPATQLSFMAVLSVWCCCRCCYESVWVVFELVHYQNTEALILSKTMGNRTQTSDGVAQTLRTASYKFSTS